MFSRKYSFKPNVSYLLLGPRGTGKTFWLKRLYPKALFVDLLEARTFNTLTADPQRLAAFCAAAPVDSPVIIDEIQKLPALLDEVHRLIEQKRIWFILTGSSARKLRQSGVNLLGGRAVVRHFHPFTAAELDNAFDLAKALRYGLVQGGQSRLAPLGQEVQTRLRRWFKGSMVQTRLAPLVQKFGREVAKINETGRIDGIEFK